MVGKIGTNPVVTILLSIAMIAGLVTMGTHFSQRHSDAKALQEALESTATAVTAINR